jgi:hypothetical protein
MQPKRYFFVATQGGACLNFGQKSRFSGLMTVLVKIIFNQK